MPKSALAEVEKIYKKAKKKKNHPQIIKSLLYKSKFALTLEEDAQLKVINQLKQEITRESVSYKKHVGKYFSRSVLAIFSAKQMEIL